MSEIERLYELGVLIAPEVFEKLENHPKLDEIINIVERNNYTFIGKTEWEEIQELIEPRVEVKRSQKRVSAQDFDAEYKIYKKWDVGYKPRSGGTLEDFHEHFLDRLNSIRDIFKSRFAGKTIQTIEQAKRVRKEARVAVMVYETRMSKNGNKILHVEDETGDIIAIVTKDSKSFEDTELLMGDEVILIEGRFYKDLLIVDKLYFPDVPYSDIKTTDSPLSIAYISDIHVGSIDFMEQEFTKLIKWIRGEIGDEKQQEKAGRIKYLFVGGDVVDGIGVYPNQEDRLEIVDIYEQYKEFSKFLSLIPDYIEVFVCPGNHDATRRADPQPIIPKDIAEPLYELPNVHMVSSPSLVETHGIKSLMYHGNSFDSIIKNVPGLTYLKPEGPAIEALKRRHLSPLYGTNPVAPEKTDYLVIREKPDVFHTGHLHKNANTMYKGTWVINSGCWQRKTDFQIKQGHVVTAAKLPLLNIDKGTMNVIKFGEDK